MFIFFSTKGEMRKSRKKKKKKTRNFGEMNLDEQQGPLAIRVSLYFLLQFYTPADSLVFLREHGHGNSCVGYSKKKETKTGDGKVLDFPLM